jgi:hypothetical protein
MISYKLIIKIKGKLIFFQKRKEKKKIEKKVKS